MLRPITRLTLVLALLAACGGTVPSTVPTTIPTAGVALPTAALTVAPTTAPTAASTGTPMATPTRSPAPSLSRDDGWRSDIAALVPGMDQKHPQLDHGVSLDVLNAAASDLSDQVGTLTDNQLLDGVMRIAALVSSAGCDAHTGAYVWGGGGYPVSSLPLKLRWFDDGVWIIDALDPYRNLVGSRITSIAGMPIDEVIAKLDPVIPRDNDQTVRLLVPRYLLVPEFLDGVGIATGSTVTLDMDGKNPAGTTRDVAAIPIADYNDWAGPYGLLLPADPDVLYLSRQTDTLWSEMLDDGTLYVQYNEVASVPVATIEAVRTAATAAGVKRIVFDLRHNTGGEVSALDPITSLLTDPDVVAAGPLFVITGRNTFSAASMLVARLVDQAHAQVVGESMSGCPTTWGNSRDFVLPFSKIGVSVSTFFEVGVAPDDPRKTIEPDISAPLTEADWSAGIDPALTAIQESAR